MMDSKSNYGLGEMQPISILNFLMSFSNLMWDGAESYAKMELIGVIPARSSKHV